jgi:ethanolamine utilization cobalamin adenosyltransferase
VIRLKVITEAVLRVELKASEPAIYYIEEGKLLSPAAREYLQQRKIKIANACEAEPEKTAQSEPKIPSTKADQSNDSGVKFIDYETGAYYREKPEHMTHLHNNVLVVKNHPRILFRGKLDSLQSLIVLDQAILAEKEGNQKIINDLSEILGILREIMRCDVLDLEFKNEFIIGLNHVELRERSHNPMKYYKIKEMVLPDYTMGKTYALLNQLRTAIRETEVASTEAFRVGTKYTKSDIIEELNRLSSSLHIMMCMYLAGQYC